MDFITDQTQGHLTKIASVPNLPAFVKAAEISPESVSGLHLDAFADPVHREFPIDDPGRAFLSWAFMKSAGMTDQEKYKELVARVKRACTLFGIEEHLKLVEHLAPGAVKTASTKVFAYTLDFGEPRPEAATMMEKSGGVHGFYPISNAAEVEASATILNNEHKLIGLPVFVSAARNVVKAAKAHAVKLSDLPPRVVYYGDERQLDAGYILKCAQARTRLTGNSIYEEMARTIPADSATDPDQWVELWQRADGMHKVAYSEQVPDPYRVFYSGALTDDVRDEMDKWIMVANTPIPRQELSQVKRASVAKFFCEADVTKIMEIVSLQAQGADKPVIMEKMAACSLPLQKALVRVVLGKNPLG